MTTGMIFAIVGVALFAMGAGGVLLHRHLLRRILAFNVMGSGAFLVLVGLAQRDGTVDPVPQAMVLTGIVVAVAATALALALTRRLHALTGMAKMPPMKMKPAMPVSLTPTLSQRERGQMNLYARSKLNGRSELSDVGRVLTRHTRPESAEAVGLKPDLHPNRLTEKNGDA